MIGPSFEKYKPRRMTNNQNSFTNAFEGFSTDQLIDIYYAAPSRLKNGLQDLEEQDLTLRPRGEQTWTIFDIICHLADSEAIGYTRILKTYLQDTTETISSYPRLALYNQELWVCDSPYLLDKAFLKARMTLFQCLRENNSLLFRQMVDTDWNKRGSHLEYGQVTLRFLLELYTNHAELHLKQILSIRDLINKPVEIEPLLPVLQ